MEETRRVLDGVAVVLQVKRGASRMVETVSHEPPGLGVFCDHLASRFQPAVYLVESVRIFDHEIAFRDCLWPLDQDSWCFRSYLSGRVVYEFLTRWDTQAPFLRKSSAATTCLVSSRVIMRTRTLMSTVRMAFLHV